MKKAIIAAAILVSGCYGHSFAQADATAASAKEKKLDMYIGVQLNALIRQGFNFYNSTVNTNTNPYLLVYSLNSRKTGWGARLGIGYEHNSASTNDGITSTKNNIDDLRLRIGAEKLFQLARKWSAGAGLDLVYNNDDDHTISTVNGGLGSFGQTIDTKTTRSAMGGGPQGWLRYSISDRVLIGTEASFYYITGKETRSMTITSGGFPGGSQPDESNNLSQGNFNSPIAFFIYVKI